MNYYPHATKCEKYNVSDPSVNQSVSQSVSPVCVCVSSQLLNCCTEFRKLCEYFGHNV